MSRVNIMGVGFDSMTLSQAVGFMTGMVERGESGYVVTPNPEIVYACRNDSALSEVLNGAALVAPDGIGIVHASRLLKTPLPERVPGIELGERLAAWMAQNGETALSFGCKARNCRTRSRKFETYPSGACDCGDARRIFQGRRARSRNSEAGEAGCRLCLHGISQTGKIHGGPYERTAALPHAWPGGLPGCFCRGSAPGTGRFQKMRFGMVLQAAVRTKTYWTHDEAAGFFVACCTGTRKAAQRRSIKKTMDVKLIAYTPAPDFVVAAAARTCYSTQPIDRVMEKLDGDSAAEFVEMLSELGHESPIEHASFTFAVEGVSRSLLAQITRHRIASFSVRSQRYVSEKKFSYVTPPQIADCPEALALYEDIMEREREAYNKIASILYEKRAEALRRTSKRTSLRLRRSARRPQRTRAMCCPMAARHNL